MYEPALQLRRNVDYSGIDLSEEQDFVLACIDGGTPVSGIAETTGLRQEQVHAIVAALTAQGLLEQGAARALRSSDRAPSQPADSTHEPPHAVREESTANYRRIFAIHLRRLSRDERAAMARMATDDFLAALCLDPLPLVIRSVLENPLTGLKEARLIARFHRSSVGLAAMAMRAQFLRDSDVQYHLMRNSQTPDPLLSKILRRRTLKQLYRLSVSRELSERAKRSVRLMLRRKFNRGAAEECAGLIFASEGRCLSRLVGLPLSDPMVVILCRRTQYSRLLIMNLFRFPSTPPKLLMHLARQRIVKMSRDLKRMLLQHPNCPASIKRR